MLPPKLRRTAALCTLCLLVLVAGCHRKRRTRAAAKSDAYADQMHPLVEARHLNGMRWPDFAAYAPAVQQFYDDRNFEVAWVDNGKPSRQAAAFVQAFQHAEEHGLIPADYDAAQWDERVRQVAGKAPDAVATFDVAMTVSVMRYISDLRIGRVNPTHFNFDINAQEKKYDLPEFVSDNAVDADDVLALIRSVEPDSDQYRRTEQALGQYLALAQKQAADPSLQSPLPAVPKPIAPGGTYPATAQLAARLAFEGDLTQEDNAPSTSGTHYTQQLADAVQHYQARHGLAADGRLTQHVLDELNMPMTVRIAQLSDSLERWRWLPNPYLNAPLMVNLPEFVLRGYDSDQPDHKLDFTMKVVVGKVVGEHQTPVFTRMMKYLIFRPYWNVPISIIRKELMPHIRAGGVGYLASKNFETVDSKGAHVEATAAQVERGGVVVREKPGPKNSLGLIKFMFPNDYDIYLHSTPAPELFNRSRRDFSHGCVRVQKPDELAVWVLRNTPGDWDLDKVDDMMKEGPDNHTVVLKQPIPIVIFYITARVEDDGTVDFFDDLYGYDKQLNDVLAKGRPYPAGQQKINPNTKFGDTE